MHKQFCCMHVISCVVNSEPQTHEKHMSYVCMYTHFFIHAHACLGYRCIDVLVMCVRYLVCVLHVLVVFSVV